MVKKKPAKKVSVKKFQKVNFKRLTGKPKFTQKHALMAAVVFGVIVLGVSGWVWWTKIFINPERLLDDAIANGLTTTSLTRQVTQDDNNQKIDQVSYISFYAPTTTTTTTTNLTQKGLKRQETKITTDTIGSDKFDLVRYSAIEGADNLPGAGNVKDLIGVWAKKQTDPQTGQKPTFLNESLFSIVPMANLKPDARGQLVDLIKQKGLYKFDSADRKVENYRTVYVYRLSINPADLISVLAEYAKLTGVGDPSQFNPDDYAKAPKVPIEITVDLISRRVAKISYSGQNRTESYSGYNLYRQINIPEQTITIEELQKRLQGQASG